MDDYHDFLTCSRWALVGAVPCLLITVGLYLAYRWHSGPLESTLGDWSRAGYWHERNYNDWVFRTRGAPTIYLFGGVSLILFMYSLVCYRSFRYYQTNFPESDPETDPSG